MRFKKKKARFQSISLPHREWGKATGAFAFLAKMKFSEILPLIKHDYKIVFDGWHDRFALAIPIDYNFVPKSSNATIISLDPGIRTPWVGYDPGGKVVEFAPLHRPEIQRLQRGVDSAKRRLHLLKKVHGKKRKISRVSMAIRKKITRVSNLVREVHCQTASYLCKNYATILLPDLKLSTWLPKKQKKMNRAVRRGFLAWRHWVFKMRLLFKAREKGCKVLIVDEHYTTKTCGTCGRLNDNIGGSKTFTCPCGYTADRDHNAARNILLRYLTLNRH